MQWRSENSALCVMNYLLEIRKVVVISDLDRLGCRSIKLKFSSAVKLVLVIIFKDGSHFHSILKERETSELGGS